VLSGQATNTNCIVFGLTRPWLEPTNYHTNHYATDVTYSQMSTFSPHSRRVDILLTQATVDNNRRLILTDPRQLRSSIIKGISVPTSLLHLIPFLFFFFTWYNNFLPNTYFVETINDYVNREWKRLCTRATQCRCRQWKKLYIHVNN
jgi:hypothetical protein